MRLPVRTLVALGPIVLLLACGSEASTTGGVENAPPVQPPVSPPVVMPPTDPPVQKGAWKAVVLPTKANVNAAYAPREGLAFFGTDAGMYRLDGKEVSKVDLGCACTIEDIDRDTGLAIGTDGTNVYAGIYDGARGYKAFDWKTSRVGPKARRVAGNATSFVYAPVGGNRTVRYDPTALFGSPTFGPEADGGDLLRQGDHAITVWGSVGSYWVAGGRGMYSHAGAYVKATQGDYLFMDVWAGWALRLDTSCNGATCGGPTFLFRYDGAAWTSELEITAKGHGEPVRFWMASKNSVMTDIWTITQRVDGGAGTGADPVVYGGAIGHVDQKDLAWRWVDFPKQQELLSAAFTASEAFVTGRDGVVYRCVQPGCDAASSAPK